MKIFNNFDTTFKDSEYSDQMKKHWNEKVVLIQRTFAFWVMNWIIPLIIFLTAISIFTVFHTKYLHALENDYCVFWWVIWITSILFLRYFINTYLDYKMDFSIITKEWVSSFKQLWFFNSKNKDLPASKIRSISSARYWLLWNIFWYWYIEIITDWSISTRDEEWAHLWWKMTMTYVKFPIKLRKKIIEVCLMKG